MQLNIKLIQKLQVEKFESSNYKLYWPLINDLIFILFIGF